MNMRICTECDEEFNPSSPEKKRVGGLATHCPDCSTEIEPRSLGFASGDGKMASISIVKPASVEDAKALKEYWHAASGMSQGKSCQMHRPALTMPHVKFKTVSKAQSSNHKGRS